jgi:hypothetical protein
MFTSTRKFVEYLRWAVLMISALAVLGSCKTTAQKVAAKPELFQKSVLRPRLSPEVETRRVQRIMRDMTLEQKIGQRFICWIDGNQISEQTLELVRQGAAGLILYPWRFKRRRGTVIHP